MNVQFESSRQIIEARPREREPGKQLVLSSALIMNSQNVLLLFQRQQTEGNKKSARNDGHCYRVAPTINVKSLA
jgi:hypothetical protein